MDPRVEHAAVDEGEMVGRKRPGLLGVGFDKVEIGRHGRERGRRGRSEVCGDDLGRGARERDGVSPGAGAGADVEDSTGGEGEGDGGEAAGEGEEEDVVLEVWGGEEI